MKLVDKYFYISTLALIGLFLFSAVMAGVFSHNIPLLNFLIVSVGLLLLNWIVASFMVIIGWFK